MATTNYNLPTINGTMTGDIPRDMNALANGVDSALKVVNDTLSEQLADNTKKVNDRWVSVLEFGAKGDGVTDDTLAIQAAIDSLGIYKYEHPNPFDKTSNGGGVVYFPEPSSFYKVVGTLKYRSSLTFVGDGYTTTLKHTPTVPRNFMEADITNYASFGSHHFVKWQGLVIVGDRIIDGTGLSDVGLDVLNTRYATVSECVVCGFNTGIKMYKDSTYAYGYFNTVERTYCYNNVLNVDLRSNGSLIIGGELSNNNGWRASDYMLKITGAGVSVIGTCLEGSPNIAQVSDRGIGTAYTGNYTETTEGDIVGQKPFVEVEIGKALTSVSLQGIYNATLDTLIKFKNLFDETADGTPTYSISYGITINSGGVKSNVIQNNTFRNYLNGWSTTVGVANYVKTSDATEYLLGSRHGIKIVQGTDTHAEGYRLHRAVTIPSKQSYVTCVVKLSSDAHFDFYAWDFGETGAQYGRKVIDYGNGWYLYVIPLSNLDTNTGGVSGNVAARLRVDSPLGSSALVTNIQVYSGGFPVFPSYEKVTVIEMDHKPSGGLDGYFYKGDIIKNTNRSELGTAGSKYVIDGWDVLVEGYPPTTSLSPVATLVEKRSLTGS